MEHVEMINDLIYKHAMKHSMNQKKYSEDIDRSDTNVDTTTGTGSDVLSTENNSLTEKEPSITHSGKLLIDATACPQDIAYPTDLKILNASRD